MPASSNIRTDIKARRDKPGGATKCPWCGIAISTRGGGLSNHFWKSKKCAASRNKAFDDVALRRNGEQMDDGDSDSIGQMDDNSDSIGQMDDNEREHELNRFTSGNGQMDGDEHENNPSDLFTYGDGQMDDNEANQFTYEDEQADVENQYNIENQQSNVEEATYRYNEGEQANCKCDKIGDFHTHPLSVTSEMDYIIIT